MEVLRLLGSEGDLTSASNVNYASLVRVNNTGSAAVVTHRDDSGVVGTVTLQANEIVYIRKQASDTLEGGAAFKVVKVAFSN